MLSHEPDWERYLKEVCDFLDEDAIPMESRN